MQTLNLAVLALALVASPFAARASGSTSTSNVNVVNTPSVNVANTPTVNVGNIPVVTLGNTPAVTVANGLEKAQRVKIEMLSGGGSGAFGYAWGPVPAGKRILVESITAVTALAVGEAPPTTIMWLGTSGQLIDANLALPLQRVGTFGPYEVKDIYSANLSVNLKLEAGDWIVYSAYSPAGVQALDFMKVTVWGVMVDAPAP
jgi:hypothetical protein